MIILSTTGITKDVKKKIQIQSSVFKVHNSPFIIHSSYTILTNPKLSMVIMVYSSDEILDVIL